MELKPGYKFTEAGVIPSNWDTPSLEELTTSIGDGLHGTPIYSQTGEFYFINGNNLENGKCVITPDTKAVNQTEFHKHSKQLNDNSILMSINGTIGNLALHDGRKILLGKSAAYLNVKSTIERKFIYYALQTNNVKKQFLDGMTGSTIGNLGLGTIRKTILAIPKCREEQKAIAEALSDVDALIDSIDRLITKKRDLKQATMQQLLTGKTRLPGFEGTWIMKRLGDIIEKIIGGGTPSRSNHAYWGGNIPWATVKDLSSFNPDWTQESITSAGLKNSASHLIPQKTLIVSTRMALGKAVIYEVDVAINQDLKALFLKPENDLLFTYYWFEANAKMIDELGSGSTVKGISIAQLRAIRFPGALLPEQQAIATVLSNIDLELNCLEKRLEKTKFIKQGMMQELLTGRTRLI